jgi:hypothetical protein
MLGHADTENKKREIVKSKYPEGNYLVRHYGKDGSIETVTKDGHNWKVLSEASQFAGKQSVGELAGTIATLPGAEAMFAWKILKPAIGGAFGKAFEEYVMKGFGYKEPGRKTPIEKGAESFFLNSAIGLGTGVLSPIAKRVVGVQGTPGARAAVQAADDTVGQKNPLLPITGGQFTSNKAVKPAYLQLLNYNLQSRTKSLARFKSLKDNLSGWIDEHGIGGFGKEELAALYETSSDMVDEGIKDLTAGKLSRSEIFTRIKDGLSIFRKSESVLKNTAYKDAFDIANRDMVELDFGRVHKVFDEIEKGVPVQTQAGDAGTSDSIGAVGAGGGDPVRYLTPDAELSSMIKKARGIKTTLSPHNPDGDYVSSLEQMNAVRRSFSEFAWENVGTNQGQKAEEVLKAIDESIENPVSSESLEFIPAYAKAKAFHAAWRTALDLKKIVNLNKADMTSYENFIGKLMQPGNGPTFKLMDDMFRHDPGVMDSIRNTYLHTLQKSPDKIFDALKGLKKDDPEMYTNIFKNPADADRLIKYGKDKDRLESAWFVKQAELDGISEGQRVLDMLEGNPDQKAKRITDYLKFKGPEGRESIRTALLYDIKNLSETVPTDELGESIVSGNAFIAAVEHHKDIISQVFTPKEIARLKSMESYALKIRDTEISNSEAGTSLAMASQGGKILSGPGKIEKDKDGVAAGTFKFVKDIFFSINANPRIISKILGLDEPISSKTRLGLPEESLQSIINYSRVAGQVYLNARSKYDTSDVQSDMPIDALDK